MTVPAATPADRWYSAQPSAACQTADLKAGLTIVADRKPFRIDRVTELAPSRWPDGFVEAWRTAGMPDTDTWKNRPMLVVGFWDGPAADTRQHETAAPARHLWDVLPEHYTVCHKCQELPPCSHVHNERIMQRASRQMDEAMAILPGACHGCREPITRRQKSFTFPGPNLARPDLGDHTAIFHTRDACRTALTSYDKRWAAAEPDRDRLFYCEGTIVHHHNGTRECSRDDCTAKGDLRNLVTHRCLIRHVPGASAFAYGLIGRANDAGCWCLDDESRKAENGAGA
jgi:hypothetical protein